MTNDRIQELLAKGYRPAEKVRDGVLKFAMLHELPAAIRVNKDGDYERSYSKQIITKLPADSVVWFHQDPPL